MKENSKFLDILEARSKENPISSSELAVKMNICERSCRFMIAELQAQGKPIVALKKGYWMGTPEEVIIYKSREYKRVKTLLKKLTRLVPECIRPKLQECFDFLNNEDLNSVK